MLGRILPSDPRGHSDTQTSIQQFRKNKDRDLTSRVVYRLPEILDDPCRPRTVDPQTKDRLLLGNNQATSHPSRAGRRRYTVGKSSGNLFSQQNRTLVGRVSAYLTSVLRGLLVRGVLWCVIPPPPGGWLVFPVAGRPTGWPARG